MGLFGTLKSNINHGGVKVQVQAPSSVPGNQVIPVTVTLTADSSQTINSVKAEIKAQAKEQGLVMGNGRGMGVEDRRTMHQTIAQVESREPFTIGPGETKTVNLQLYISGSAGSGNPLGQMGTMGGIGGALQAVASVAQNFEHINYIYSVQASADVQGVSLDPSDKQPIQILPPAAVGAQTVQLTQPVNTAPVTVPTTAAAQPQPPVTAPLSPMPGLPTSVQPIQNVEPNSTQTQ